MKQWSTLFCESGFVEVRNSKGHKKHQIHTLKSLKIHVRNAFFQWLPTTLFLTFSQF